MLLKLSLLLILLIACGVIMGREVLVLGKARREGDNAKPHFLRFRRRTKGLVLLIILYLLAAFFESAVRALGFHAREIILYVGITLILLIWLLILAGRDMRETALNALEMRRKLSAESMEGIEQEIRRFREQQKKPDAPRPPPVV